MVGAEVDHEDVVRELRRDLAARAVRQREHDDVVPGEVVGRGRDQLAACEGAQVRVVLAEQRAGVGVRRERADLDLGMVGEEPQGLPAGVAARSGDRHSDRHMHDLTYLCAPRKSGTS
ncbi:hypothetical protein GCM10025864_40930 [Luteimicrobium album]|uniref:Uncharacterized protein n=1 Tax=Luteimicrobium album TaxID=1054550 RepID=A0ABQ6I6C9_9MICO|nr:hypothetical protein GCM10025864_40930 [Luteimicrobium album]